MILSQTLNFYIHSFNIKVKIFTFIYIKVYFFFFYDLYASNEYVSSYHNSKIMRNTNFLRTRAAFTRIKPSTMNTACTWNIFSFSFRNLQMHFDDAYGAYFDFGNHTEKVNV